MKVILVQTIPSLGVIGETKDVKSGYARNFLFPRRLAILTTDTRAKELRRQRAAAQAELQAEKVVLAELAGQWRHQKLLVTARASADGTLYGSIGPKELRKVLGRDDLEFRMPVLKTIGSHAIDLTFRSGLVVPVVIDIRPETSV